MPEPDPPDVPEPEPPVVPEPDPGVVPEPDPGVVPAPGYVFELPEGWQPGDDFPIIRLPLTDEEQMALIPIEWYAPDDYLPEWYQPGDSIHCFSPNDMYLFSDGAAGFGGQLDLESQADGGVGVPEPGALVLLITGGLGLVLLVWRRKVTGSLF
jgi:hypothetical protein